MLQNHMIRTWNEDKFVAISAKYLSSFYTFEFKE